MKFTDTVCHFKAPAKEHVKHAYHRQNVEQTFGHSGHIEAMEKLIECSEIRAREHPQHA